MILLKHRIFAFIVVALLLISFASCDNGTTEYKLSEFSCAVSFKCNDADFIGNLRYISADNISLTIDSPEHIKGIKFIFDGNKTDIVCDGLTVALENLTADMDVYTPLFSALVVLSAADIKVKKDGTDSVVLGENTDISIKISCDDMRIISVKNCGNIYNFQYN